MRIRLTTTVAATLAFFACYKDAATAEAPRAAIVPASAPGLRNVEWSPAPSVDAPNEAHYVVADAGAGVGSARRTAA